MNISKEIIQNINRLPESKQLEVIDFIYSLKQKTEDEAIEKAWQVSSLLTALQGMEHEDSPYTLSDLKETYS